MRDFVDLAKPRLSTLVFVTAACGMILAPGNIEPVRGAIALFATAVVIGAANALNSYLERDIDGLMLRTRHRPLPAGRIAPSVALVAALVASILALPTLAWAANGLTAVLGATALVVYVAIYTPAKRSTSWALLIGAVPGAIPPLMGYTAVTGAVDTGGLVLFGVLFFWQLPHFLAISLYLREDYARAGIRTVSLVHGEVVTQRLIAASAVLLLAMTLLPWPLGLGGMLYGVLALLIGGPLALWAALGLRRPLTPAWSRSFFFGTLAHLTVLMVVLLASAYR
ncbi:MAG: heme o synthase [Myxococcota bacterium]